MSLHSDVLWRYVQEIINMTCFYLCFVRFVVIMFIFQLRKSGFQKIDALDPSKGMLEKAKEKNLYRNYVCELLTKETFKNANGNQFTIFSFFCNLQKINLSIQILVLSFSQVALTNHIGHVDRIIMFYDSTIDELLITNIRHPAKFSSSSSVQYVGKKQRPNVHLQFSQNLLILIEESSRF